MSDLEQNKKVVVDYFQSVMGGNVEKALADYLGPGYIQHNPYMRFGPEGVVEFITRMRGQYPELRLDIKRVIAEGDMVVTHSHLILEPGKPGRALADYFRLENGRIVEHWDVIQDVPRLTPTTSACSEGRAHEQS
ncbi:nuclear transport factor 2 family protein [Streptomyces sp. NPDC048527]|uniref:nuclear transport factor 2 family protein n=1 Tax=Streptomyces sp. NPDC048527 TaxID=3365568 RepID=UPI00371B85E9